MGSRKQGTPKKPRIVLDGSVYLLLMCIDGVEVYKVGVTAKTVGGRCLGIIESVWSVYGYFPRVEILFQERTRHHYEVESEIHRVLRERGYSYRSGLEFSGSTELFHGIELKDILKVMRECLDAGGNVSKESVDRISTVM